MQYAFPLLAIFIWAGNTVINKLAVGAIFPAEIGFYRWLLAGLLFTPFMLKPVISHWPLIRPSLGKISLWMWTSPITLMVMLMTTTIT